MGQLVHHSRYGQGKAVPTMSAQDFGVIRRMWQERGEDTPFALCFGVPPAAIMVSGMHIPKGVNEGGFVGSLLGQPLEVVKCETNDIWVPRNAEIVLEGIISSTDTADEGLFAEYHGHMFNGKGKPAPVFNVNAITYREDPILSICVAGRATEESETVCALTQAAEVLNICQLGCQLKWSGVLSSPTNLNELIWAEATRCQPQVNEFFFDAYGNIPLIPYVSHGLKETRDHVKAVRCCMFPAKFPDSNLNWKHGSFRGSYSQEIQDKVDSQWAEYGF